MLSLMSCRGDTRSTLAPAAEASTVIGGLFPLADGPAAGHSTARILSRMYADLAVGAEAPWALRRAQRWWRSQHDAAPVNRAGLTAMTTGAYRR